MVAATVSRSRPQTQHQWRERRRRMTSRKLKGAPFANGHADETNAAKLAAASAEVNSHGEVLLALLCKIACAPEVRTGDRLALVRCWLKLERLLRSAIK